MVLREEEEQEQEQVQELELVVQQVEAVAVVLQVHDHLVIVIAIVTAQAGGSELVARLLRDRVAVLQARCSPRCPQQQQEVVMVEETGVRTDVMEAMVRLHKQNHL